MLSVMNLKRVLNLLSLFAGVVAALLWLFAFRYGADLSRINLFFLAHDVPGDVSSECTGPVLGNHYFGDHQSIFCQASDGRPYSAQPAGEYFPFAYFVYRLVRPLSLSGSLGFLLLVTGSLGLLAAMRLRSAPLFLPILAGFPVLFAVDRGNLTWVVATFLVGLSIVPGRVTWIKRRCVFDSLSLAIAGSLKPLFLPVIVFIILKERKPHFLWMFVTWFLVLNLLISSLLVRDVDRWITNSSRYATESQDRPRSSGISFNFADVAEWTFFDSSAVQVMLIFLLLVGALVGCLPTAARVVTRHSLLERHDPLFFVCFLSQVLILSGSYTFLLYMVPIFVVFRESSEPLSDRRLLLPLFFFNVISITQRFSLHEDWLFIFAWILFPVSLIATFAGSLLITVDLRNRKVRDR